MHICSAYAMPLRFFFGGGCIFSHCRWCKIQKKPESHSFPTWNNLCTQWSRSFHGCSCFFSLRPKTEKRSALWTNAKHKSEDQYSERRSLELQSRATSEITLPTPITHPGKYPLDSKSALLNHRLFSFPSSNNLFQSKHDFFNETPLKMKDLVNIWWNHLWQKALRWRKQSSVSRFFQWRTTTRCWKAKQEIWEHTHVYLCRSCSLCCVGCLMQGNEETTRIASTRFAADWFRFLFFPGLREWRALVPRKRYFARTWQPTAKKVLISPRLVGKCSLLFAGRPAERYRTSARTDVIEFSLRLLHTWWLCDNRCLSCSQCRK